MSQEIGNHLMYGNDRGRGLLAEIEQMRHDMAILLARDRNRENTLIAHRQEHEKHHQQDEEHRREIQELRLQNEAVRQASEGYLGTRRRFIDFYERDVKSSIRGSKAIQTYNTLRS